MLLSIDFLADRTNETISELPPWIVNLYWTKWALAFVLVSFFLATCARVSWSLSFLVHVNLIFRIASYCLLNSCILLLCKFFPGGERYHLVESRCCYMHRSMNLLMALKSKPFRARNVLTAQLNTASDSSNYTYCVNSVRWHDFAVSTCPLIIYMCTRTQSHCVIKYSTLSHFNFWLNLSPSLLLS